MNNHLPVLLHLEKYAGASTRVALQRWKLKNTPTSGDSGVGLYHSLEKEQDSVALGPCCHPYVYTPFIYTNLMPSTSTV